MDRTEDFHRHALTCRNIAAATAREDHRAALLAMAAAWDELAGAPSRPVDEGLRPDQLTTENDL